MLLSDTIAEVKKSDFILVTSSEMFTSVFGRPGPRRKWAEGMKQEDVAKLISNRAGQGGSSLLNLKIKQMSNTLGGKKNTNTNDTNVQMMVWNN